MMTGREPTRQRRNSGLASLLILMMLAALFGVLAWGFLAGGTQSSGLAQAVDAALVDSGVESRVTAVLLNYRTYDTLLECFVLLLGVVAVWSLQPYRYGRHDPPLSPILSSLVRLLAPLMVLVSGYLVWAGSNQAGGAFQAGAIIGGAGVLFLLTSSPLLAHLPKRLLSLAICMGPLFFLLLAVGTLVFGGNFLEYRRQVAAIAIAALEAVAALSIGISLAALFGGSRPAEAHQETGRDGLAQGEGEE